MFTKKEKPKYQQMLEEELERVIARLDRILITEPEEYAKELAIVERLHSMMPQEKTSSVSKDTLANVGANLLGIFMIIKHERVNVITSKALSFVTRLR